MHVCYLPIVDTLIELSKRFCFSYTLIYLITVQVIDIFISVHVFLLIYSFIYIRLRFNIYLEFFIC